MKFVQYLLSTAAFAATGTTAFSPVQTSSRLQQSCSSSTTTTLFAQEEQEAVPVTAEIQFVRGLAERVVPDVRLTRSRDGNSGVATFKFVSPNVFDASTAAKGEITGMFMMDDEGEISTTAVNASFANGKPQAIESTYVMNSPEEWDRFMRFMQKYGEANGLGFNKA